MAVSPVPPGTGARFDRVIDLQVDNQRLARLCALFPRFKQNSLIKVLSRRSFDDRDERFANGRWRRAAVPIRTTIKFAVRLYRPPKHRQTKGI